MLVDSKKREEAIFNIFRDRYCLGDGFIHQDSPDFIGSFNGSTIGIEITEIYNPKKINKKVMREHEKQKERIVNRACEKALKATLPPLHVTVIFTSNIHDNREHYLTETLFEMVKNNCPEYGGNVELNWKNKIPNEFHNIHIYNIPSSRPIWKIAEAGFVRTSFSQELQNRIDSKSKKIETYLSKCNKCWLIIAALGASPSNFYKIDDVMEHVCYESPFEKVFFMEVFSKSITELKVKLVS